MATIYKHGTYGELQDSIARPSTQSGTIAVYVGTAPVNLIRGYTAYVNSPVYLTSFNLVKRYMGYSDNWGAFTLCEAFKAHFDNSFGNVGPIIAINVLDPATHKKAEATTKQLTFVNKRATIDGDTIILDTLVLADKVEGTDFTVDYDFTKKQTIITDISSEGISTQVQATYSEVDTTMVKASDIIGGVTSGGVYSGLGCVGLIYPELNWITNIIAAPGWSEDKTVYEAMINAANNINGHWQAWVVADIPIDDNDTIDEAITWRETNGYTNERTKTCWPQGLDGFGNIYHGSTAWVWGHLDIDATHNGVPMETPSNKPTFIAKQYFGASSTNRGFDQQEANRLNEKGISTFVYWGGSWVLWGPHTAAYEFGAVTDPRVIFDNNMRMMFYVLNNYQQEWAPYIDKPMTRHLKDTILNREQEKADALVAIGALIGKPVVSFDAEDNPTSELVEGNFVWSFEGTPTPPFKSGTIQVAYTDAGVDDYVSE